MIISSLLATLTCGTDIIHTCTYVYGMKLGKKDWKAVGLPVVQMWESPTFCGSYLYQVTCGEYIKTGDNYGFDRLAFGN